MKHIVIEDSRKCCGCSACSNICKVNCITMTPDREGFLYPLVDETKCIDCGRCIEVCPMLDKGGQRSGEDAKVYAAWNKNHEVLSKSSSGGVFSSLAGNTLQQGGIVVGAAFQGDMELLHSFAENLEELGPIRGSKYIQSNMGKTYKEVGNMLSSGKKVLFSGTPCQVAGLYGYLGRDYENLMTCEVICYGVASNLIFSEYLRGLGGRLGSEVAAYRFREKSLGWEAYGVRARLEDGREYLKKGHLDPFIKGFLNALYLRPSCYDCPFKGFNRSADITLGDFWGAGKYHPEWKNNRGISLVLAGTEKGASALRACGDNTSIYEESREVAAQCNPSIIKSPAYAPGRTSFFNDYWTRGYAYAEGKYMKPLPLYKRIIHKAVYLIRSFTIKMNPYD